MTIKQLIEKYTADRDYYYSKELEENNADLRRLPGTALINDLTSEVIYTSPDNFDTINQLMNNLEEIGVLRAESKGKEVIYINEKLCELVKKGI